MQNSAPVHDAKHAMFKIDIHTHILPKTWPKFMDRFGQSGFIQIEHDPHSSCGAAKLVYDDGRFFRSVTPNCWDPQVRLEECDQSQVQVQVLSTVPVKFYYWAKAENNLQVAQYLNDHISGVVDLFPKRFVGLATLPLQDPELSCRELHRCMTQLNFRGVQIGSHINSWNLDDPHLYPFYAEAEKLQASLFVHPWDMMGSESMPKYWLPWLVGMPAETSRAICSMIFGGIFEKFPRLKVAFAHGGGSFPGTIGRITKGFEVRPDLCAVDNPINPKDYLGRFYVDSLVHDPQMLLNLIDLVGANRVALGSDYPFPLGEARPGEMIEQMEKLVKISHPTKEFLFYKTALDWLGLDLGYFL